MVVVAGAMAVATSGWSVAAAQGYEDGEHIPLPLVETVIARITATIYKPVTVDFEGGYTEDDDTLSENVTRLLDLGVAGIGVSLTSGRARFTVALGSSVASLLS